MLRRIIVALLNYFLAMPLCFLIVNVIQKKILLQQKLNTTENDTVFKSIKID